MGDIAINAPTVQEEEAAWTKMLDRFAGLPDIEVRVRCGPAFWKKGGGVGLRDAISACTYTCIYIICINLCIWVIGLHWILCKTTMLFSLTTENQTLFKNLGWKKGCDDHVVLQSYCVFHQLRQPRQLFSSSGQVGGSLKGLQPCNWAGSKCSRSTSESWSCLWIHGSFRGSTQRLWCGVVSWHTFKMVHSCFHMTDFFALEIS